MANYTRKRRVFRRTQRLQRLLGKEGIAFLEHALGTITRLLPHTELTPFAASRDPTTRVTWDGPKRRAMNLALVLNVRDGEGPTSYALRATLTRQKAPRQGEIARTLDLRERDLCERVLERTGKVLHGEDSSSTPESLRAIARLFDEQIVASHIQHHNRLQLDVSSVFRALRQLAEQSYENKSIAFGCLLDSSAPASADGYSLFPESVLNWKKYKALSDGYRTVYRISADGKVIGFEDLEPFRPSSAGKHFYPDWTDCMAGASTGSVCGICLTRHGDLLVFDAGTLRFTYRFGKWQYWNHSHILDLFKNRARAQRVPVKTIGAVVNSIYRAALDVSFRRCGGLFVLLRNRNSARDMILKGDAIGDRGRRSDKDLARIEKDFDSALPSHLIQTIPRRVMVELAGLDGAVVVNNQGHIITYAAVLQPKKKGKTGSVEGSRTKAAVGASKYGIAVKVSSDGDITFYEDGDKFLIA